MSLDELLAANEIRSALIVDDVFDPVPTARDLGGVGNGSWTTFSDDLPPEIRDLIEAKYPRAAEDDFEQLIHDDRYVAALWELRAELGSIVEPIFETYLQNQAADLRYVQEVERQLTGLGLACSTAGRDFVAIATTADLIVIDLFIGNGQDDAALDASTVELRKAIAARKPNPPLVLLMSRSSRLDTKRETFRDEVGLLESAFRIVKKSEIAGALTRQIERLASNAADSRKLARFFSAMEQGLQAAGQRAVTLLRRLQLSDIGQIRSLLLSAEGAPTGSYLVDVFDRALIHELEAESNLIDAAKALNDFLVANHPTPYLSGSPELQELVRRSMTQHANRLSLPGAIESRVAFGDIIQISKRDAVADVTHRLLVDLAFDDVALVLTPACDLQRREAPRILLLIGKLQAFNPREWSYKEDAKTPAIEIDGAVSWIKWNLKHLDTVSHEQLDDLLEAGDVKIVARLRESHALELQQRVLSGLGRVGLIAKLPATFPVGIEVYYLNTTHVPTRIIVPELAESAVCFVGRDSNSNPLFRLVLTETCCDGILRDLQAIDEKNVSASALPALQYIKTSQDLQRVLREGLELGNWDGGKLLKVSTRSQQTPKMALLALNPADLTMPIHKDYLRACGLMIVVRDDGQALRAPASSYAAIEKEGGEVTVVPAELGGTPSAATATPQNPSS